MDAILWRRLDTAGHDACRLLANDDGWRLQGTAVFRHGGAAACLAYEVACDGAWHTLEGVVRGWADADALDFRVTRLPGGIWTLNDQIVPQLDGCVDLDLAFTPATNLIQLRRVALEVGEAADVPVAWLDVFGGTLETLQQRYERRAVDEYGYEAPRLSYAEVLRVAADGFVQHYPRLWEAAS
jgi:hypothetical protein